MNFAVFDSGGSFPIGEKEKGGKLQPTHVTWSWKTIGEGKTRKWAKMNGRHKGRPTLENALICEIDDGKVWVKSFAFIRRRRTRRQLCPRGKAEATWRESASPPACPTWTGQVKRGTGNIRRAVANRRGSPDFALHAPWYVNALTPLI